MKAMGILVAGASLAACAVEPSAIRSTQSALTCNTSPGSLTSASDERQFAASCLIHDQTSGTAHYIYVGGFGTAPSSDIYDSTNGTTYTKVTGKSIGTARFNLSPMVVTDAGKEYCAVFGGNTNAGIGLHTPSAAVDVISVNTPMGGSTTWTVVNAHAMAVARELPQMNLCGTTPIAFGGLDSNGHGISDMETLSVAIPDVGTAWSNAASGLNASAGDFFVVKSSGSNRYVAGGGVDSAGNVISTLQFIDARTKSCSSPTTFVHGNLSVSLSNAAHGNVGMLKSTSGGTDVFTFATGRTNSTTLNNQADEITVNWNTPTGVSSSSKSSTTIAAQYRPNLVKDGTKYTLINGQNAAASAALQTVQQYDTSTGNWSATCNTIAGHFGGTSELLGGVIYTVGDLTTTIDSTTP